MLGQLSQLTISQPKHVDYAVLSKKFGSRAYFPHQRTIALKLPVQIAATMQGQLSSIQR